MRGKVNSVSGDNIKFIEKEYNSATVYNEGDTVSIRGVLYSCLVNNTTGTLNMDRWKRVYLSDLAEVTSSEQALADMVDEVYDPSKTYNKDDTALYNEVLYICKNDGTTGKWNADLWEQTTLVSILNSNLGGKLLWTNSSPSSTFAAQTISLDLSKYNYVIISAIDTDDIETEKYSLIKVGSQNNIIGLKHRTAVDIRVRTVDVSTASVVFGTGKDVSGGVTTGNKYAVPYHIYGIKQIALE